MQPFAVDIRPLDRPTPRNDVIVATCSEERSGDTVTRTLRHSLGGAALGPDVFWRFTGRVLPDRLDNLDFVLLAMIFPAMRLGRDLHVDGPVSGDLLESIEDFQEAFVAWRSRQYRRVNVSSATVDSRAAPDGRAAVLAYSGGMDANYSYLRHQFGHAGLRRWRIAAALMVHGFDVGLDQGDLFASARGAAERILSHEGTSLVVCETNWKQVIGIRDWGVEFGAGLASCLSQYHGVAAAGLIGSDEDYASLELPWGSNPITNHLMGSRRFRIVTDGTGSGRTDKAALVGLYGFARDNLRVCWKAAQRGIDGNCGRCEKCIRTKLNFTANRVEVGASLATPHSLLDLMCPHIHSPVQIAYLRDIVRTAKRNRAPGPWRAVRVAIALGWVQVAAYRVMRPAWHVARRVRRKLRRLR